MNLPEISVGMPFYNREATLETTIRSLLNQTHQDFELLLCDDGSSDRSLEIANSFDDSRIVCWSDKQNKRLPARLNECIDRARGRFFARMDSDDVAYPQRLERQARFLREHQELDLCGTAALIFGKGNAPLWKFAPETSHAGIVRNPYKGFPMLHPTWMGRIEWFRKWRYNEAAHLGQDQEILMRAYRASTYANIPDILLGFRQETVPLRKLLRNKISWIRYVRESGNGPQNSWENFLLLAIQVSRFGANCLAKALGPAASLPRQRALPPSDADKQQLQQLLRKVDAGPLLTDPFALESDMAKTNA